MEAVTCMEAIMRTRICITLCLAAPLLLGCDFPSFTGIQCFSVEPGDCPTPVPTPSPNPTLYMIGFPRAKLDTASTAMGGGVRGLLRIGDTVTFYVVSSKNFPNDTLRSVAWSADTTTARFTVRSDGGMTLQATALGQLMVFTGNMGAVWSACGTAEDVFPCTTIDEMDVVP